MRYEIAHMRQAGRIEAARIACALAEIKVPDGTERLAIRKTKNGWMTTDGRRVTRSDRDPSVSWVDVPSDAVWDSQRKTYV